MTLVPIALPPGLFKNGTEYQSKGRWFDGDLIRWHNGALAAIGGWAVRLDVATDLPMDPIVPDPSLEAVRDITVWTLISGASATILGSNLALYYMDNGNVVTDITPAGFVGTPKDPDLIGGFGQGFFGVDAFGTPRIGAGIGPTPVVHWDFGAWGEEMLACVTKSSLLYSYADGDAAAVVVPNAPTGISGVVVTNERIVMVIGNDSESRLVQWSDRENRELWVPAVDNLAGNKILKGNGKLLSITNVLSQMLILTETDAHVARWVAAPYIYGFDLVGKGCAPVSGSAVVSTDRFAIWLGVRTVWMYDGTIKPVQCDVMDFLTEDMDFDVVSKIIASPLSEYSEVWWLYQSTSSTTGEVDSYVVYDHLEQHWSVGRLDRTSMTDRDILAFPIMVSSDGVLFNHELDSVIAEGAFAETGPLEIAAGDKNMAIRYIFPDGAAFGDVEFTFFGKQQSNAPEITYGPFPYAEPISTTGVMGRRIRMKIELLQSKGEIGVSNVDVAPVTGMR